jgi:hypothetical protein
MAGVQTSFPMASQYIYHINVKISPPHTLLGNTDLHARYYYQHFKPQEPHN